MGQPITTDPLLIAAINMTVVFAVLYGLSLIIRLIQVIDPTQKKKEQVVEIASQGVSAVAAPSIDAADSQEEDLLIVFTAAVAAYSQGQLRVTAIRPIISRGWAQNARVESVGIRNRMF